MNRRAPWLAALLVAAACGGPPDAAAHPESTFDPSAPGPVELPGEPMSEPFPWRPVTAAATATLVAAALVARRLRRALPEPAPVRVVPPPVGPDGPHVAALERLSRLRARQPRPLDDHVATATIVREYVRDRFGIRAPERTTDEVIASAQIAARARHLLADVLHRCDLVKFARDEPPPAAREPLLDAAATFVRETAAP